MNKTATSVENIQTLRKRNSKQNISSETIKVSISSEDFKKLSSTGTMKKIISKDDFEKMMETELEKNPFFFF